MMRVLGVLSLLAIFGCDNSSHLAMGGTTSSAGTTGSGGGTTSTGGTTSSGGGTTSSGGSTGSGGALLKFAVFGDSRPANENDTAAYPSAVISAIFAGAQSSGAQFVVGTGDYMFAKSASAVDAQLQLFLAAQGGYTNGPVYHAMGNHECNGYTNSNCPNGNETPNVQAFMSKLVPSGTPAPYYRVDVPTPMGNAKLLFIAANAWSPAQESWLTTQLADATAYTFVVRHEPTGDNETPGVGPSDSLMQSATFTLALFGHSHEYRRLDTKHVISGNGGAPLAGGGSFGYLMVEQQANGDMNVSEIDSASGSATDTWSITSDGNHA